MCAFNKICLRSLHPLYTSESSFSDILLSGKENTNIVVRRDIFLNVVTKYYLNKLKADALLLRNIQLMVMLLQP